MPIIKPDTQLYNEIQEQELEPLTVEKNSILSAFVGIKWQGNDCQFTDWSFIPNINLWRDYLPPEIEAKLPGLAIGDQISHHYLAGELLEDHSSSQHPSVPVKKFQPPKKGFVPIQPLLGRYYPKDFFTDVEGIYEGNKFPCRITSIDDQKISIDLNHPLAGKDFEMIVQIDSIKKAGAERGGRCNDITAITCENGPGMQDNLMHKETDFFAESPFERLDQDNDAVFYKEPDLTAFWDSAALLQVSTLYNELIPEHAKILDLMAGAHSPLQETSLKTDSVSCAGLNKVEMKHNSSCDLQFEVDVNGMTDLPFDSNQFDTVLIHAAIEYVIHPELLFAEINRILKPSGRVIISFSNRSIAEKAIHLWTGAHEFERPAIVLSYLRSNGSFCNFQSYSKRGMFRPDEDKLANKLLFSDPVYMIWADKK